MKRILVMILVIGLTLTNGCARKSTAQDSDYNNHVENSPIVRWGSFLVYYHIVKGGHDNVIR